MAADARETRTPAIGRPVPERAALADVVVHRMRRRHLSQVLAIERVVYPRPWSPRLFAAEIRQPETRRYLVALARDPGTIYGRSYGAPPAGLGESPRTTRGDSRLGRLGRRLGRRHVVGYAGVLVQAGEAHVTTVAVHPSHHRRKIATHLLLALLREAIGLGAEAATLEVRAANRGAQRLYSSFGFSPVGVRPNYYSETNEDAVIMWAHDLQRTDFRCRLDDQEARLTLPGGASGAPDLHVPWVKGRQGLPIAREGKR